MGRRLKNRQPALHGWINLNKPESVGSFEAVRRVRRWLGGAKVGHGGTLDPFASGVLPLAVGEATKAVSVVLDGNKHYQCRARWGIATDTLDRDGQVVARSEAVPTRAMIEAVLGDFCGEIMQAPPAFSAVKVNGKRAYGLARRGETLQLEARPVRVSRLRVLHHHDNQQNSAPGEGWTDFDVECGKGMYVRALIRDMAEKLGTLAHLQALTRRRVGGFALESAVSLDDIRQGAYKQGVDREVLSPIEWGVRSLPGFAFAGPHSRRLASGVAVPAMLALRAWKPQDDTMEAPEPWEPASLAGALSHQTTVTAFDGAVLLALARVRNGLVTPTRVFRVGSETAKQPREGTTITPRPESVIERNE